MHSLVVFVVPLYIFQTNILNKDADNNDLWSFSVSSFTAVILVSLFVLITFIDCNHAFNNYLTLPDLVECSLHLHSLTWNLFPLYLGLKLYWLFEHLPVHGNYFQSPQLLFNCWTLCVILSHNRFDVGSLEV